MRILYIFYGHFNALFGLYSFIFISFAKIIVALDSSYINTYKTTPSSSFYTVYCQRYSDYKNVDDQWRPSWIFPRKMETVFFQSFRVNISEKSQLFKIYMKKSQNDTMPYTILGSNTNTTQPNQIQIHCFSRFQIQIKNTNTLPFFIQIRFKYMDRVSIIVQVYHSGWNCIFGLVNC